MDKYKINYIFNEDKDINDILINVLNKELKKYIQMICKNDKMFLIDTIKHEQDLYEKTCEELLNFEIEENN